MYCFRQRRAEATRRSSDKWLVASGQWPVAFVQDHFSQRSGTVTELPYNKVSGTFLPRIRPGGEVGT